MSNEIYMVMTMTMTMTKSMNITQKNTHIYNKYKD